MVMTGMRLGIPLREVILIGSLCCSVGAHAGEERSSMDWLRMIVSATHELDYSGIFVYQHDNRVETSRITHIVKPDSEYEKLESLDGPKNMIVRHHGQVWCSINRKMEQVDSRQGRNWFPSLLPEQMSALSNNYSIKLEGKERVADHDAQVIWLQPIDSMRYAHKFWVDKDSGLLLKSAVMGKNNKMVEQYAFTQLQIGGNLDRSWVDAISRNYHSRSDDTQSHQDEMLEHQTESHGNEMMTGHEAMVSSGWVVDSLPRGFKKTLEIQRRMRGRQAPVTQMVFSDGLSAISVFIEPVSGDQDDAEGLSSRGGVNLYHKIVDQNIYTVVGEVPPHTVMQVLDSVRRSNK